VTTPVCYLILIQQEPCLSRTLVRACRGVYRTVSRGICGRKSFAKRW